jgi:hypothetical protein
MRALQSNLTQTFIQLNFRASNRESPLAENTLDGMPLATALAYQQDKKIAKLQDGTLIRDISNLESE